MTRVGLAVHRTFHAVSHSRNFRLFFVGQLISVTGTWMQSVASAWLVLQLTGSGVALGFQTALNFGPVLFLGAWGGLLADRLDKRRILIGTQSAFAILAAALWALVATGTVQLWHVYALSALQGVVTSFDNPTRQSFYAEMVGRRDLANAVSLNAAVMTATRIVGPAVAGVVIAVAGLAPAFAVNAVSYVAVIGALWAMRAEELIRDGMQERRKGQVRDGLRYVWRTPALRLPLIWMAVLYTFSFNFSVLFPLFAEETFRGNAGTYGTLLSALGVGSLIGALALARKTQPTPRRLAVAAVGFGAVSIVAALMPTLRTALVALVPMGLASMAFMILANSTLQLTSRPEMRGRVMALYGIVFLGSTPFGAPVAGWAGEHLGPRAGIALGGLIALVTGLAGLWALARRRRAGLPSLGPSHDAEVEAPTALEAPIALEAPLRVEPGLSVELTEDGTEPVSA
ncbi:MAG: MFS transporter [Candidatus Velamenicoccus archaeovorus]